MEAINTPVLLTYRLSNKVLAAHVLGRNSERLIVVNTRFKIDPEVLAHALLEEYAHAQQVIDGVDIEGQRRQFPYSDRPYEQEAKRTATSILGVSPNAYDAILLHEEPAGPLYDRPFVPDKQAST